MHRFRFAVPMSETLLPSSSPSAVAAAAVQQTVFSTTDDDSPQRQRQLDRPLRVSAASFSLLVSCTTFLTHSFPCTKIHRHLQCMSLRKPNCQLLRVVRLSLPLNDSGLEIAATGAVAEVVLLQTDRQSQASFLHVAT